MVQAYHGVTAAQHQTNFNTWSAQGYRMISLSVYGDTSNPLYAAVWIQRQGSPWAAVHGVDSAGYQAFFNTWTAKGYSPVLVSATGPENSAVFAAVFEQGINGAIAQHGLTGGAGGSFLQADAQARANGQMLRSFAIYGTLFDRRYAAVWHPNPVFTKCHLHPSDNATDYQTSFNAETQLPGYSLAAYRAAYIAVSEEGFYCSAFKDDYVGPWSARHNMTSADYQAEFDKQKNAGFYPICVQGGGSTSSPVYAAIFAKQDLPASRQWSATGTNNMALAKAEQVMQAFMQTNGVRAAQLAIAKNGKTLFSRAYTWAEPGYHLTQPSDRFLLASCSKMFLEAAVQSLYDSRTYRLDRSTKVYPLLGFSGALDPRSDTITIQQLLDHTGGYDDSSAGSGFDPTYNMRSIGLSLFPPHPVTKLDIARYMYARMLDYTPYMLTSNSGFKYSNFGHMLAGAVVEKVTGKTYFEYVKEALLDPLGINEVRVFPTLPGNRAANEIIAEDEGLGLSPLNLNSPLLVPNVYGGEGEINEVGDPNDGMGASAQAMAQFIHTHAVWNNGGRAPNSARAGSTPGASSYAESRTDDVDWSYTINTRNWPPSAPTDLLKNLNNAIDAAISAAGLP